MQPSPAGTSRSAAAHNAQVTGQTNPGEAQPDAANSTPLQRAAVGHLAGNAQLAQGRPALSPLIIPNGGNSASVSPPQVADRNAIQVGLRQRANAAFNHRGAVQLPGETTQPMAPRGERVDPWTTPVSVLRLGDDFSQLGSAHNTPSPLSRNSPTDHSIPVASSSSPVDTPDNSTNASPPRQS